MSPESGPSTPDSRPSTLRVPRPLLWIAGAVLAWFAVSEVATEVWYRYKESQAPVTTPWQIEWPTEENAAGRRFSGFQSKELGDSEKEILRFDKAASGAWRDAEGNQWTGFFLEWEPDKRLNQNDVTHNPTVCMPAAGLKLVKTLPDVEMLLGNQKVRFNAWEFDLNGRAIFVYMASRWPREHAEVEYRRGKLAMRLANLWKAVVGNRGNALQTIELVVVGPEDETNAAKALEKQVAELADDRPGRL